MSAEKRTLYVGGLAEEVDVPTLKAAFVPFGEIIDVNIPLNEIEQKNRGFGFVEFELVEDAAAALENMNGAELFGKVLKVNIARPMDSHAAANYKPVWETHTDELAARKEKEGTPQPQ
eukprot:TRINITY_DN53831_c0_g1_i1.p1 TRINITY_DN53831_c0_g1~~TRINITY_DN53831_c0_g1_i1.p1  ORF type:complete len:118 (+),score=35.77 TRINITY_DN53831_c0_g1_i1:38-391(+)